MKIIIKTKNKQKPKETCKCKKKLKGFDVNSLFLLYKKGIKGNNPPWNSGANIKITSTNYQT